VCGEEFALMVVMTVALTPRNLAGDKSVLSPAKGKLRPLVAHAWAMSASKFFDDCDRVYQSMMILVRMSRAVEEEWSDGLQSARR